MRRLLLCPARRGSIPNSYAILLGLIALGGVILAWVLYGG